MSGIHIGSRVVCIKRHSQNLVLVGKEYLVADQTTCLGCGSRAIDVGINRYIPPGMKHANRCVCGMERLGDPQTWILEQLFAPLEPPKAKENIVHELIEA